MPTCYTEDGMSSDRHAPLQMPSWDYPNPCTCWVFSLSLLCVASFLAFLKNLQDVHTCQGVLVKWPKTCVYVHVTGLVVLERVLDNIPHREKLDIDLSDTHSILLCLQCH